MPSSMIHLLTGYKINPDAPTLFWLGNIAPDAIGTREEKDVTHFRDVPDRTVALKTLVLSTDHAHPFEEGVLLHLYLDWLWDTGPFQHFVDTYSDDDWFRAYRHEIALAGAWLFHHVEWSKRIWLEMTQYPKTLYGIAPGVTVEDLTAFVYRNFKWHMENDIGPSSFYTPDFVENFTSRAAREYTLWRKNIT